MQEPLLHLPDDTMRIRNLELLHRSTQDSPMVLLTNNPTLESSQTEDLHKVVGEPMWYLNNPVNPITPVSSSSPASDAEIRKAKRKVSRKILQKSLQHKGYSKSLARKRAQNTLP